MKKILCFACLYLLCCVTAMAAVRDGTAVSRTSAPSQQRVLTTAKSERSAVIVPRNNAATVTERNDTKKRTVSSGRVATTTPQTRTIVSGRGTTTTTGASRATRAQAPTTGRAGTRTATVARGNDNSVKTARAAAKSSSAMSETRTGAQYEQCKNAFFSCMDQFCTLKNDDYRRCSCSNRVIELDAARRTLQDAGEKLTVFTENLDVVGMTAAQATAMHTASEGENALTADKSASKALLQAIMNSIRGDDTSVGGKYSSLNSVNMSFDTVNAFGIQDATQAVSEYNGKNLYSAVYPQCRNAVRADCNDASLQRAITAYLMAVEQDCNTVQTAVENKQKEMKAAVREGSAMLDLARVENRQKHNSDSITACINNVQSAILSEEVCGANYRKCLDNGEFIDLDTGAPIAGVERFYELEHMLTFNEGGRTDEQKLSKVTANRTFVQNFEKRVKKFAAPALDKCTETADVVWAEYLDKALLDIFYAQRSKVSEIKQGCFDFISTCYSNTEKSLTEAMRELVGSNSETLLQPDKIALSNQMCSDYIASCDHMFDNNIIAQFLNDTKSQDTTNACRAVAYQCFNKYGGSNFENFYYPSSGVIKPGRAADWFSLYQYDSSGEPSTTYVSECAKQLAQVDSCNSPEMMETVFGGFDLFTSAQPIFYDTTNKFEYLLDTNKPGKHGVYGLLDGTQIEGHHHISHRTLRPSGVATEVYHQIISKLQSQCSNMDGRFMPIETINPMSVGKPGYEKPETENDYPKFTALSETSGNNLCKYSQNTDFHGDSSAREKVRKLYSVSDAENMCPNKYDLDVDVNSWGTCSCWENGARRSKNGQATKCLPIVPAKRIILSTERPEDLNSIRVENARDETCHSFMYFDYVQNKSFHLDANAANIDNSLATTMKTQLNTKDINYLKQIANYDQLKSTPDTTDYSQWCTLQPSMMDTANDRVCPLMYQSQDARCVISDEFSTAPEGTKAATNSAGSNSGS